MPSPLLTRRGFLSCADRPPPPPGPPPVLKACDRFADVPLVNQLGDRLRFRPDLLAGRALVVNAMFTTCRGSCPATSSRVRALRTKLAPVFGNRLVFVSFTLEPAVDTPAKLRAYAGGYGAARPAAGLPDWHFVTGAAADLDALRKSLGLYDLDPKVEADVNAHAATLLFGNAVADRWAVLPAGVREGVLTEAIRRVAGFTFEQRYGLPG